MESNKKRDLEIVYNLLWKNDPANGGEKANIVGMYDIPATTLNWEVFKSYLLKNAGTALDDVKVSYITSSNREFPIQSQRDFEIALYAFRRKARMNEIITLKLDRVSSQQTKTKTKRQSIDVETQFDVVDSPITPPAAEEEPPMWFTTYMAKFKEEVSKEIKSAVAASVSNLKPPMATAPPAPSQHFYHSRKSKPESKRSRKYPSIVEHQVNDKEIIRSLKLERKLENKLEKLENKTKKIKEKKLALFTKSTSDSDAGPSHASLKKMRDVTPEYQMDAAVIKNVQDHIPRFQGGEIYMHTWNVVNTGLENWTSDTYLQYTWGSKALHPIGARVPCPKLKPGEQGTIGVQLKIPFEYGTYECYWHFHHMGRRFGQWLGCQLTVDPFHEPPTKVSCCHESVDEKTTPMKILKFSIDTPNQQPNKLGAQEEASVDADEMGEKKFIDQLVNARLEALKIHHEPTDTNCSSDSDNQSVKSSSDEAESGKVLGDEFVLVPVPIKMEPKLPQTEIPPPSSCYRIDSIDLFEVEEEVEKVCEEQGACAVKPDENFDTNNNTESRGCSPHNADIILTMPNVQDGIEEGYAYVVNGNGQGMHIPKKMIKTKYLTKSEEETKTTTSSSSSSVVVINDKWEEDTQNDENSVIEERIPKKASSPRSLIDDLNSLLRTDGINPNDTTNNPDLTTIIETPQDIQKGDVPKEPSSSSNMPWRDMTDSSAMQDSASRLFVFPKECPGYEVRNKPVTSEPTVKETPFIFSQQSQQYESRQNPNVTSPNIEFNTGASKYDPYGPLEEPSVPAPIYTTASTNCRVTTLGGGPDSFVPNYQQTPPAERRAPNADEIMRQVEARNRAEQQQRQQEQQQYEIPEYNRQEPSAPPRSQSTTSPVHLLPDTLVTGAVNVASSAINTARSVINMIVPPRENGAWVNGHWVSQRADTPREANLRALAEMGFWDRDLNATLLARYDDDLTRVISELVQ